MLPCSLSLEAIISVATASPVQSTPFLFTDIFLLTTEFALATTYGNGTSMTRGPSGPILSRCGRRRYCIQCIFVGRSGLLKGGA